MLILFLFAASLALYEFNNYLFGNPEFLPNQMWLYPPSKRKLQLFFVIMNIVLSGSLYFLGAIVLILYFASSIWGMLWVTSLVLAFFTSIISIFRPRLTFLIFFFYGVSVFGENMASWNRERISSFKDTCNELRLKPNCEEIKDSFRCVENQKVEMTPKNSCLNKTGGNSDYNFKSVPNVILGQTVYLNEPVLSEINLPRNQCKNRFCGHIYEKHIVDFQNRCGGCLREQDVSTKLRMKLIDIGETLKVVESYQLKPNGGDFSGDHEIFVLEDKNLDRYEISHIAFELLKKSQEIPNTGLANNQVLKDVSTIRSQIPVEMNYCYWEDMKDDPVLNFIKIFHLEKEVEIIKPLEYEMPSGGKRKCQLLSFKTEGAYLITYYYHKEFGFYSYTGAL